MHSYDYKCSDYINYCSSHRICECVFVKAILILILYVSLWTYVEESYAQTGILLFYCLSWSLISLIGVLELQDLFVSSTQPSCTLIIFSRYKRKGHSFDSQWGHWDFALVTHFRQKCVPGIYPGR
jgi:hypothetical protein